MHLPAHLPAPLRAAVGLVATAADEAKHLPDRAVELPMLAVSTALQLSLRAQQRYAQLTVRGDEALSRRSTSDGPPAWATFDDDPDTAANASGRADSSRMSEHETAPGSAPAAKKTSAKKTATRKTAVTKDAPAKSTGKGVSAPRHTNPSRFDTVGDE